MNAFSVGDKVNPTRQTGLAPLPCAFVVSVLPTGLWLSREPNGRPITDLRENPRVYDPQIFYKAS